MNIIDRIYGDNSVQDQATKPVIERQQSRQQKAWQVAKEATKLLLDNYQVKKVALFGSLLNAYSFGCHSDIDLTVWDLADSQYYRAVNDLSSLSSDFSFDKDDGEV